jgi:hypothetical protein
MKFHVNFSDGFRIVLCGRMDRHDETGSRPLPCESVKNKDHKQVVFEGVNCGRFH